MQNNLTNNTFMKTIGRATYRVQIFFCESSKESFDDKLLRVIKNDILSGDVDNVNRNTQAS
jgi:hypothetical protein